jgi:hypothetical protein
MNFLKKFIPIMLLVAMFTVVATPIIATPVEASGVKELDKNIYKDDADNILAKKVEGIVKIVAGVGGVSFVLAILIISLFIIFGSISANQVGTWWKALFSCMAGAFIFFSAYAFAPAIATLAFK